MVPPLHCLLDCFLFELHSMLSDATSSMCVRALPQKPPTIHSQPGVATAAMPGQLTSP